MPPLGGPYVLTVEDPGTGEQGFYGDWNVNVTMTFEVGNPSAVFDGDLDGFLEAGIRWRRGQERAAEN